MKNKPIGCAILHFPKKIGKSWVCMYCGETAGMLDELSEKEFSIQMMWMNINTKIAWAKKTKINRDER